MPALEQLLGMLVAEEAVSRDLLADGGILLMARPSNETLLLESQLRSNICRYEASLRNTILLI